MTAPSRWRGKNLTASRILAQATVGPSDLLVVPTAGKAWRVEVAGRRQDQAACEDQRRIYHLSAETDNLAAQEGIRRFVAEMEALSSE